MRINAACYLKDAVSDEKQPRQFSWKENSRFNANKQEEGENDGKWGEKTLTLYLSAPLIFLISQQGFCALLHPTERNQKELDYEGITNGEQDS